MNWKYLILGLLVLETLYSLVLHIVEYRSASNPTPANVADVYDQDAYLKWRAYSADQGKLSIGYTLASFAVTLALLCSNAFPWFAGLFPAGAVWQMLAVLLLYSLIGWALDLIRNYIRNMVIEEKYGFNRTTLKTFVIDQLRGLLLEFGLSFGIVYAIYALHRALGDWVVVLFAGVMFCFSLAVSFLYPILSRIGNKFVPLEEGELRDRLMELLTKHGYQVKQIEVMDASRRTTKLNAYFTGFGKLKTIVLYDNLVNAMTTEEICAVFSHELGHGLHKDVLKMQIMNLGNMLLMGVVAWLAVREPAMHEAFGFAQVNYGLAYILMSIGLEVVQPLSAMVRNAYSRFAEYRADRQAILEGYGDSLVAGLKKLAKENFSHLAPSPILVALEYSHPPLSQRIDAIEKELTK